MKKIMKSLVLVAVAAMGLTACQNDIEEQIEAKESVTVEFIADSAESRTSVDTEGDVPVFSWDSDETFAVLEQTATTFAQATEVEFAKDDDGKATITATFDHNAGYSEYKYVAVYPESKYMESESINAVNLYLSVNQTMYSTTSYDPNADLMVSRVVTTAAQPTEAQYLQFTRLAAVAKMAIKGVEEGDAIERVVFSAEDKTIAGTISIDLENVAKEDGTHTFTVVEGSDSVSVDGEVNDGTVYFTTLPFTLEAGDSYTITVVTENKIYRKEGSVAEGKSIPFEAGNVTRLGVDLSTATAGDKWVLVKDVNELEAGDIVAIAAVNSDYVMGAKWANNYPYASETEIVRIGDYLYHPITTDNAKMIQKLTLAKRDNSRNAFDFYNGANDYEGDDKSGFLWAPDSGSKYLKLQDYYSANTQFDVSIDPEGVATIIATNGTGSSKQMMYNSSSYSSSRYFHCYSEISDAKKICIYRIEGGKGTLPVVAANVVVPTAPVTIAEEGTATATAIEDVVFNYVGNWTISVSDDADWLTVSYADEKLTYTATANTGSVRTATITITASLAGQTAQTWTFQLTQKGAPQEITIAEFNTKTKDDSTIYKLTGKITTIPSSATGKFVLVDAEGNKANVQYLKMENGGNTKDNVELNVGDVMTVTTKVTATSTTSGNTGGNSSNYSYYKGHYTVTATASGVVGYAGGDAIISVVVEKFGYVVAPTAISDNSNVATDGNPVLAYSFTDKGNGTANAVVSFGENTTGGTRKIDLTFSAGSPLSVSTSITVVQDVNPALKTGWWLVTDASDLKAGDKVIIAATALDYAISTASNTNNRNSTAITKNGGTLENVSDSVQQYALEVDANGLYSFKGTLGNDAGKYIYAPNTKNYMKVTATLADSGKWTISIASDGAATITSQGAATYKYMQYNNKGTSSPAFYCTDGSMGDVCLYKYYE